MAGIAKETTGLRWACRGAQVAIPPDQVGEIPRGTTFRFGPLKRLKIANLAKIRDLKIKN
jgi:hypothetical protein